MTFLQCLLVRQARCAGGRPRGALFTYYTILMVVVLENHARYEFDEKN